MAKIKQMPEALSNQIAAGEVVERPASVVKELVENAIDANSSEIIIELAEAGIQQIKVTDNGEGMAKEDLSLAFLPHATSKIYNVVDLFNIQSLGFRGEALASIASVSKVRVDSKTEQDETANYIEIAGSEIVDEGISQAREGTSIQVDSLFYNTPARLKHLKTIKTELSHSLVYVQNLSLSYPDIRLRLIHNGQQIFTSSGNGDLQQAIANVYQPALARDLIAIKGESDDFSLEGYISGPTLTRTSRKYIHWIINGRVIKSHVLDKVLVKAYGRQLMIGRYPIAIIKVNLDARLIDVNVHPTKQTVRLSKEDELSELITETIQETLQTVNPIPNVQTTDLPLNAMTQAKEEPINFAYTYKKPTQAPEEQTMDQSYQAELQRALQQTKPIKHNIEESIAPSKEAYAQTHIPQDTEELKLGLDFYSLRYVGQIHGTYLIAESEEGFYLIDQHAAQERIRYEALMNNEVNVTFQQQLLMPLIFNFSASEMSLIDELLPAFEKLGIHLEAFGPNSYQLESYPNWIEQHEVESIVRDLIDLLVKEPHLTIPQLRERSIIMQSCRGAIKANHYLDDKQAVALIESLDGLDDPYHCPHGRPVFVEFNQKTLEKLFKRIQDSHEGGIYR